MDPQPDSVPRFEPTPVPDRCFELWLAGTSYSAIGRQLGLDRETVSRYVRLLHAEAQAERRADRALALTRALAVQRRIQAVAWDEIERQQAREDAALRPPPTWIEDDPAAGRRPAPYRAQVARLLNVILASQREEARLERLYEKDAPARAGDGDTKTNQAAYFLMLRRSDQEEMRRLGYEGFGDPPPAPPAAPDGPRDEAAEATAETDDGADDRATPDAGAPDSVSPSPRRERGSGGEDPATLPADADGIDDWYVHTASPPGAVPSADLLRRAGFPDAPPPTAP